MAIAKIVAGPSVLCALWISSTLAIFSLVLISRKKKVHLDHGKRGVYKEKGGKRGTMTHVESVFAKNNDF